MTPITLIHGGHVRLKSRGRLRYWMDYRDVTIRELARSCSDKRRSYSPAMIGHLLSGYTQTCSPRLANRIVKALQVPIEELFEPKPATADRRGAA